MLRMKWLNVCFILMLVFALFVGQAAVLAEEAVQEDEEAVEGTEEAVAGEEATEEEELDLDEIEEMSLEEIFELLQELGIFTGYADGSPGFDKEMTRAEFAAVLTRIFGLEADSSEASFTDTANHWAHTQGYIEAVVQAGLMNGVSADRFDPNSQVTVEQVVTVLLRAFDIEQNAEAEVAGEVSDWARGYVAVALEIGLLEEQESYRVPAKRAFLMEASLFALLVLELLEEEWTEEAEEEEDTDGEEAEEDEHEDEDEEASE